MGIFDRSRRTNVDLGRYYPVWAAGEELEQLAWELGRDPARDRYQLKQIHQHRGRGIAFAIYNQAAISKGSMSRLIKVLDHLPSEEAVLAAVWADWGSGDHWWKQRLEIKLPTGVAQ